MTDSGVRTTWWDRVLDVALTLWVVRVPVMGILLGAALMWLVPQAQDLLIELASPDGWTAIWTHAKFYLGLFFVWALPTHYVARLMLDTDERYRARFAARLHDPKWRPKAPRYLGAAVFLVMIGAVYRSWLNVPGGPLSEAVATNLLYLGLWLTFLLVVFWLYAMSRQKLVTETFKTRFDHLETRAGSLLSYVEPIVPRLRAPETKDETKNETKDEAKDKKALGPLLLLVLFVLFAFVPFFAPSLFSDWFPRALSVPFILGGWMPLLAYLGGLGRRVKAPLVFAAIALPEFVPLLTGDNYRVRLVETAPHLEKLVGTKPTEPGPLRLEQAVALWQKANCNGNTCPRPIIVAGAGGASRAGFFTASVIGQLMDNALKVDEPGHGLPPATVANRIFALSTVSGSSVGAVTAMAALAAAQDGKPPCKGKIYLFHGATMDDKWRSCFEALNAGDFLTPTFTGYVFRDTLRFLQLANRGDLLEDSLERHFKSVIGAENARVHPSLGCVDSLECPFKSLRPTESQWLPLLVLNTTSVTTGQRVIETLLSSRYTMKSGETCPTGERDGGCEIFTRAPIFHELIGEGGKLKDMRLSTAAHNSARFPVISPPGEIRNGDVAPDKVVDGGYFENFGVQTAMELALAMRRVNPALRPFVIVLSNDPQAVSASGTAAAKPRSCTSETGPGPADATESSTFGADILVPISTIMQTRNARGFLAIDQLVTALGQQGCNVAQLKVWGEPERNWLGRPKQPKPGKRPEVRELSMSWWLSKPVQRYLHDQTANVRNRDEVANLLNAMKE